MQRRRTVLRNGVALATLGVAGCVDSGGDTGDDEDEEDENEDEEATADTATATATAGESDDDPALQDGDGQPTQATNRLDVVTATGSEIDGEAGTLGLVELLVRLTPDSGNVDLRDVVVQWVDDSGTYTLVHDSSTDTDADGTFGVEWIKDEDGSAPVVNDAADRALLQFDVGERDIQSASPFGADLAEGDTASIRLETAAGAATSVRLTVPMSLAGREAVRL